MVGDESRAQGGGVTCRASHSFSLLNLATMASASASLFSSKAGTITFLSAAMPREVDGDDDNVGEARGGDSAGRNGGKGRVFLQACSLEFLLHRETTPPSDEVRWLERKKRW